MTQVLQLFGMVKVKLYMTHRIINICIYEINEEGLASYITEYTDLLLSASSLVRTKIITNFKKK